MVQIFGKTKCFDTKKAERFFKERGAKFHSVDILLKGLSKGELTNVLNAVKDIDLLADAKSKEYHLFKHLTDEGKFEKLLDYPALFKTPIVRCGKSAAVGFCPQEWANFNTD
ncbi:MAG: ArsC family transcriptional regulator [Oscillospiraceae bacterium]|nr:ArsC family transcriptional regulator [Oscillospiraceae bacterium]